MNSAFVTRFTPRSQRPTYTASSVMPMPKLPGTPSFVSPHSIAGPVCGGSRLRDWTLQKTCVPATGAMSPVRNGTIRSSPTAPAVATAPSAAPAIPTAEPLASDGESGAVIPPNGLLLAYGEPFAIAGTIAFPYDTATKPHELRFELVDADGGPLLVPSPRRARRSRSS